MACVLFAASWGFVPVVSPVKVTTPRDSVDFHWRSAASSGFGLCRRKRHDSISRDPSSKISVDCSSLAYKTHVALGGFF